MTPYRILVTGARDWRDRAAVGRALLGVVDDTSLVRSTVLVHGDCPTGADAIAARCAQDWAWMVEGHPADWTRHGKAAGFRRNAEMVALGADVCIAFIRPCVSPRCKGKSAHDSHGTAHCAGLARAAGITVVEVRG